MMLLHLALPHEGHLDQVLQIFAYLKKYHNTELVYDPSDPTINYAEFERRDWASSEFILMERRTMGFTIRTKVNANHASDTVTQCLRTSFLVYINSALVTGGARNKQVLSLHL